MNPPPQNSLTMTTTQPFSTFMPMNKYAHDMGIVQISLIQRKLEKITEASPAKCFAVCLHKNGEETLLRCHRDIDADSKLVDLQVGVTTEGEAMLVRQGKVALDVIRFD